MEPTRRAQLVAKVLKEELREDEHTREQGLEQFRDWILKNQDIRDCPTDDSFLLPFLRARKYSVPMAEQTLMNLLKFQHKFPELNSNLDIEDPDINAIITSGQIFGSPIIPENGQKLYMYIARNNEVNEDFLINFRATFLNWHTMIRDENSHILGFCIISDYGQVSPGTFAKYPLPALKACLESLEKAFPMRLKRFHIINMPTVATWFMKLIMSFLSEKLQNRFMFHSSLEELHKHVDRSALPKEYGGTMPMDEIIGLWKKELAVHREAILAITNTKLVGNSFKNDLGSNDTGIPGSFRKLQVD